MNPKPFILAAPLAGLALASTGNAALVAYFPVDSATDSSTLLTAVVNDPTHGVTNGTSANTGASILFNAERNGDVLSTVEGHRYSAGTQDIDLSLGFTWSLWVNIASSNTGDTGADVIIGTRAGSGGAWHKIDLASISSWNGTELTFTSLADDEWHHIAYVGDSTDRRIYIDGTEVDIDDSVPTTIFNGNMEIGGSSQFSEDVTGLIDDIAIWNNRLTEEQIQGLADGSLTPLTVPEPSAALLGGLGALLLLLRRR